ncbi:penicillin-insensitive murein endopeptidase [Allokutzneria albata]|uniref:Peptidoglycan-binding (PGRP) domain of peptidoglycan hydrolases-containing protein n=1 Tax=Allokutzneria albata TaxID=211114 RepID=A0A1H0CEP0_ALLAB|nr:penicillin-insensitive murein endopeptidase [Allokutzneria albata]SDN56241.1 Peptidoglycan-binding (PGRP) domain of peptidoglycan hydrolases-containing protein [Allokutzneria albata]
MLKRASTLVRAMTMGAAAVLVLGLAAPATAAYPGAFHPTQSVGNRGSDVTALQYLLRGRGHATAVDGVFSAGTATAVKAFQQAKSLPADGIVGTKTWGALVVQVREGDKGDAVSALQTQLNAKLRLSLKVTGTFDAATKQAVSNFQSHARLGADGVAGPVTWENLLWHYAYPDMGAGLCDKDPDNNGTANWGTGATTAQLEAAARTFAATGQGKIPLGDIGFEHGGAINGHASHRAGMDVDIWPVRTDSAQCTAGRITWESPTYDRAATRQLVKAIRGAAPGHVKVIWFNDPVLIREGLTKALVNHSNHLHVRYCEKVHTSSSYTC